MDHWTIIKKGGTYAFVTSGPITDGEIDVVDSRSLKSKAIDLLTTLENDGPDNDLLDNIEQFLIDISYGI